MPAHLSSKSHEWPTPADFYAALHAEFGFVLDVCATTTNAKTAAHYALDHPDKTRRDGLAGDWAAEAAELGGAVWMNPPYGRGIAAWMAKALPPPRQVRRWWPWSRRAPTPAGGADHVLATGAEVCQVRGRLTFGDAVNTAAFASVVVIYRPTDVVGVPGPLTTMPAHPTGPRTGATASAPAAVKVTAPVAVTASEMTATAATADAGVPAVAPAAGHERPAAAAPNPDRSTVRGQKSGQLNRVRNRAHHRSRQTTGSGARSGAAGLDCRKCQAQARSQFEHVFESREWVEVAGATAGAHHA